jgi:23S rRNA pseudouridine2605 synthase
VKVPLERALSKLGIASRSEARALISTGRVRVDGRVARDPRRLVDERRVERPPRLVIALNKPRGVVTTRRDPDGRPTVYDLVRDVPGHVVAVGRLDAATSGLLLFTNDTRFADWLTDPRNRIPRVYDVTVQGRVTADEARQLTAGLRDRDDMLSAHRATIRKGSNRETHLIVQLLEGKNREVRRLFLAVGHEVTRLRRVQFGGLTLGTLAPGEWRAVDEDELERAFPDAIFSTNKLPPLRRAR